MQKLIFYKGSLKKISAQIAILYFFIFLILLQYFGQKNKQITFLEDKNINKEEEISILKKELLTKKSDDLSFDKIITFAKLKQLKIIKLDDFENNFQLELQGNYLDFISFLKILETKTNKLEISNLSFIKNSMQTLDISMKMNIND